MKPYWFAVIAGVATALILRGIFADERSWFAREIVPLIGGIVSYTLWFVLWFVSPYTL